MSASSHKFSRVPSATSTFSSTSSRQGLHARTNSRGYAQINQNPSQHRPIGRVGSVTSFKSSIAEQYSLAPSPRDWGTPLDPRTLEPDDDLHNPNSARDRRSDRGGFFTARGLANLGCLALLGIGFLALFAGYPLISHFTTPELTNQGGFNLGGINATGQIPDMVGNYGLIDKDTPKSAHTKPSYETGEEMILVFSDEFNVDGRSFYPGDDPYWEAVDLWYWGTHDLEWYDPSQVTTRDGALQITLEKMETQADRLRNHNMTYKSGMLQSWNKFCFQGGLIEASVRMPGSNSAGGLWPALWTLGNLGRAGYGASLEGLWPYSYDECDIGTLANQTTPDKTGPQAALPPFGDPYHDGHLSFLPGQRLSACTCPGESHPGPMRKDGSFVGRAAPEIDVYEALIREGIGAASQSSQWAPFNHAYTWNNISGQTYVLHDERTIINPDYAGGVFQQAVSGLSTLNQECYELESGCFAVYGFEYKPGYDDAYITWLNDGKPAWTHYASGLGADPIVQISRRPISEEPMYIITNLGISHGFGTLSPDLQFPATMSIDWIRVYQPKNQVRISCDPPDHPTRAYIETYAEAYTNAELMTFREQYGQPWPKNKLVDKC